METTRDALRCPMPSEQSLDESAGAIRDRVTLCHRVAGNMTTIAGVQTFTIETAAEEATTLETLTDIHGFGSSGACASSFSTTSVHSSTDFSGDGALMTKEIFPTATSGGLSPYTFGFSFAAVHL